MFRIVFLHIPLEQQTVQFIVDFSLIPSPLCLHVELSTCYVEGGFWIRVGRGRVSTPDRAYSRRHVERSVLTGRWGDV